MLRITIDNEEVVSNKNFTIEEEMLNTPSVILNNVYPKTWEEDKDYVNRFYHPNDYSKCKISDDTYHPEEPGITVEDTNFSIDVDTTKEYDFQSFKGQTTQNGTPTPSTPVPINVVSGRQDINVVGKNWLSITGNSQTINGITFTVNEDGSIRAKGLASANATFTSTTLQLILPNVRYRLSGCPSGGSTSTYRLLLRVRSDLTTNLSTIGNVGNGAESDGRFTTQSNANYILGEIIIYSGQDVDLLFKPQVEIIESTSTPASTYEAYKGNTYEINLGKNLLYLNNETKTDRGLTGTITDNNILTYSGTATATYSNLTNEITHTFESGTYTFSIDTPTTNNERIVLYLLGGTSQIIIIQGGTTSTTFTLNEGHTSYRVGITNITSGTSYSGTVKMQLEKGSSASSYAEYKTPIELCKIGDYQDRIYKDNGVWYLHKEIGKVVLDGSETYQKVSNGRFRAVISPNFAEYGYGTTTQCFSNMFKCNAIYESYGYGECYCWSDKIYFGIDDTYTTTTQASTWCSTNKPIFYGVLATPTTTEIEDTELISQLESIELLNGLNNISVSTPYLPFIMTLLYNHVDAWTESDLLFCGVVKNSGNISLNPREPHYQTLQILDFKTFLSEGETLDFVIYQKTIREAIEQVVSSVSEYGFVVGEVKLLNPDEIIGAYSTKDKSAYDVLNYIADITQSRWTTRMVDENTVAIDFYDPTLMEQGTSINYTQEWFSEYKIDNMYYSYGTNDYRNKQVMTSNNVYSNITQTQTIVANGYQTQFNTELPIGKIESIKINDVSYSFATNQEKEMGYVADFYYTPGNNYFESANSITVGTSIVISYVSIVEGRQVITNPTEIDRVNNATGRKGVVARYETRNDAITSNELQLIGQSYIKYKGTPEVVLTVQTRNNIWNVGQRVPFNAPIQELTGEYMVRSKRINRVLANPSTEDIIFYTYEMTSSFNSETAINYFDNQRAKANGNIGEGEYISRNIDIESVANIIFYDTEATEITIVGDNILEAILEAPFVE